MSSKYLLDVGNDRKTDMHFDDVEGTFIFNTTEKVDSVLDANKRKYNDYGDKLSVGKVGEWHHAASIPATMWEKWMTETNGEIQMIPSYWLLILIIQTISISRQHPTTYR